MTDYRAVMKLLVQQRSYRQIEQQLGCSHRTISRSNQVLRSLGIRTVDQVLALTDDELDELFVDGRSTGQGEFVPIDFDAVVKARTGPPASLASNCCVEIAPRMYAPLNMMKNNLTLSLLEFLPEKISHSRNKSKRVDRYQRVRR